MAYLSGLNIAANINPIKSYGVILKSSTVDFASLCDKSQGDSFCQFVFVYFLCPKFVFAFEIEFQFVFTLASIMHVIRIGVFNFLLELFLLHWYSYKLNL